MCETFEPMIKTTFWRLGVLLVASLGGDLGCGSAAGKADGSVNQDGSAGGGTAGTTGSGGAGGAGGQVNGGPDASVTCNPACDAGICVAIVVNSATSFSRNDAGVCPAGTHPSSSGDRCNLDPSYSCSWIPTACGQTVNCECAAMLCPNLYSCGGPTNGTLTCVGGI